MTPRIPRKWHCVIAFGLALGLLVIAVMGIALPILAKFDQYRDSITDSREALGRYGRIIAQAPALRARLDALTDPSRTASYYLNETTQSLAVAALQERVENVVKESGGVLNSVQAMASKRAEAEHRVTVRVQMTGAIDAVQKVLYALESGQPLLFLDNLSIRSPRRGSYRAARRRAKGTTPDSLTLGFDVTGYLSAGREAG